MTLPWGMYNIITIKMILDYIRRRINPVKEPLRSPFANLNGFLFAAKNQKKKKQRDQIGKKKNRQKGIYLLSPFNEHIISIINVGKT